MALFLERQPVRVSEHVSSNGLYGSGVAVVMVPNPKIGRSRVILGYFSFFLGYFRLNSIFRNAK